MWSRFVVKKHPSGRIYSMVYIEGSEDVTRAIFKWMFNDYDDYFLTYSTPPTIENVDEYTVTMGGDEFLIKVLTMEKLNSMTPQETRQIY